MSRELEATFRDLGLAHYTNAFIDNGFDKWDTILDIQESDLDALGVKLGHRRKLQRRIANARGIAPSISLATSLKPDADDTKDADSRSPRHRADSFNENGVAKRKYRRHPKPDENAPERPPSAYVLFSNKMREDVKSHNLTFTEIAKLVGENWQNLAPAEKEAYESQASTAKEKYHRDLAEYKRTPEYRKYAAYLQEFKDKQAKQNQEAVKRPKIEPARLRHGSSSSSAATGRTNSSTSCGSASAGGGRSRSGSEKLRGSEPPSALQDRIGPTTIMADTSMNNAPPLISHHASLDEPRFSPKVAAFPNSEGIPGNAEKRQLLPSLSDVFDDSSPTAPQPILRDRKAFAPTGFAPMGLPSLPRIPPLTHQASSGDSSVTSGSLSNFTSRSSGEGPVPIHTLLTNRSLPPASSSFGSNTSPVSGVSVQELGELSFNKNYGPQGFAGFQSAPSALHHMRVERQPDGDLLMTAYNASQARPPALDGMDALLKAGEIVGRR